MTCTCRITAAELAAQLGLAELPASLLKKHKLKTEPDWTGAPSLAAEDAGRLLASWRAEGDRLRAGESAADAAGERERFEGQAADQLVFAETYERALRNGRGIPEAHQAGLEAIRRRRMNPLQRLGAALFGGAAEPSPAQEVA